MTGVTSPFHLLPQKKAKEKRKLARTPGYVNYDRKL